MKDGERVMISLVKLESEAEESVWQRCCSDMDILQGEEDTRQAGEEARPKLR